MSPRNFVPLLMAAGLLTVVNTQAQVPVKNTEFKIEKIVPELVETPNYPGAADKRGGRPKKWLEVEVVFSWQPRLREPMYSGDLVFNYYVLLANSNAPGTQTLLTGTVTHTGVPQEKGMHSVMYVSPRALEQLFKGSLPPNATSMLVDVGVTISSGGQVVAEESFKGHGAWWATMTATSGILMNKSDTPFSVLAWDYYEPEKPN